MLDYQIALQQLLEYVGKQQTAITQTPLLQCVGSTLASSVYAQIDNPRFDNSAMDGYALHLHDKQDIFSYKIIGRIAAGDTAQPFSLQQGEAVRIFTGAPIPLGCNAVIAQEDTLLEENILTCQKPPKLTQHIRKQAEDIAVNELLLEKGTTLTPAALGLAASQGYTHLPCHTPLHVTVFSSGNELRNTDQALNTASSIYDANRYQLLAWLSQLGCTVHDGGILPDNRTITEQQLLKASQNSDLIITSGGVSVGEEDHLKATLEHIGTLTQWKLLIKPGKPFAWGSIQNKKPNPCIVMMLPGNPVATFVTFKMLVLPSILHLHGKALTHVLPQKHFATADFTLHKTDKRREFLRAVMAINAQGEAHVNILENQGSHMLTACVQANALVEIPPDTLVSKGSIVATYLI